MATRATHEVVPVDPIPLVAVPAHGARPGGVSRVHEGDRDAGAGGLGRDELPELSERPAVQAGSLRTPSVDPVADTPKIFEGDPPAGCLRFRDDPVGDDVVL